MAHRVSGARLVQGGKQAGRTEGHTRRGRVRGAREGRHKHGEVCRGDDETALVYETSMRAGCVRDEYR